MHTILQLLKKHPVSIFFYILYSWFWLSSIQLHLRFQSESKILKGGERLYLGEAVMYGMIFSLFAGFILGVVMIMNGVNKKEENRFYYVLTALIAVQMLILINI